MTYAEKLKDPRWQKKRVEIMSRDEFQCSSCTDTGTTLAVHHRYYISGREPWEYPDWSLRTLCKDCHAGSHEMAIRREEGSEIPLADPFEEIMGFFGAGNEVAEGFLWDVSTEFCRISNKIGLSSAMLELHAWLHERRNSLE